MHGGTAVDAFLREDKDWMSKATSWTIFSAVAGIGVIYRGHLHMGWSLRVPNLPWVGTGGSPYSAGGALYALGLFMLTTERVSNNIFMIFCMIIECGACLGLGLAALGTPDEDLCDQLMHIVRTDSAISGEAAGISMGLIMVGIDTYMASYVMLRYACETRHKDITSSYSLWKK